MITRAFPSSDTEALNVLCVLLPITDFIISEALTTRASLITNNRWINPSRSTSRSHALHINQSASLIPELAMPHDAKTPSLLLDRLYIVSIEPRQDSSLYSFNSPDHLYIFTDGSKMNDLSGAGMVNGSYFEHSSTSLGAYPTVFQAELYAISMACSALRSSPTPLHTSIHSDSQAALMALSSTIIISATVSQCIEDLTLAAANCNSLALHWVPGHSDIEGNDLADALTRSGSSLTHIGPEPFLRSPSADQQSPQL